MVLKISQCCPAALVLQNLLNQVNHRVMAEVVIAIEFGTHTRVAYSFSTRREHVYCGVPSANDLTQSKAPLVILLNDNGTYEFGFSAQDKYKEYKARHINSDPPGQLFEQLTVPMKNCRGRYHDLTATSVLGAQHSLMDLFVKCLNTLKAFAVRNVSASISQDSKGQRDIPRFQWVITVPAHWNYYDKAFLRRAAYKAGMPSTELMIISELEAVAFRALIGTPHSKLLRPNNRFVVLHSDELVIETAVYEIASAEPPVLKIVAPPIDQRWSGSSVDAEFQKFMEKFFGPAFVFPYGGSLQAEKAFTKIKATFDPADGSVNISLVELLGDKSLVEHVKEWNVLHPDKKVYMKAQPTCNGLLTISKELMLTFYEPLLVHLVNVTKALLRDCPGVRHIVVTGEFGCMPAVANRLRAEFRSEHDVRIVLAGADLLAAEGAVHVGWHAPVPGSVTNLPFCIVHYSSELSTPARSTLASGEQHPGYCSNGQLRCYRCSTSLGAVACATGGR
jgi:hypothetical protein